MGFRRTVSRSLEQTLGRQRTDRVRRAEARIRRRLIATLDVEGSHGQEQPQKPVPSPRQAREPQREETLSRTELIEALGRTSPEGMSHRPKGALPWAAPDPKASFPKVTATRHELLAGLHAQMQPRTYFEIGVDLGNSMAQSRTLSIGVDPAYTVTAEINCNLRLFRVTSDEFFARPDAFDHFDGHAIELAFIDGMHLAEYVVRDFMNVERHMSPGGVVILDDMLPRNSLEAFRIRRTRGWTGDVYKVHEILAEYRPDLTLVTVSTYPTGSYLVVGLDPSSTVLADHYAEIERRLVTPDPQVVPEEWLERRTAVDADRLLELDTWKRLGELHRGSASLTRDDVAPLWRPLRELPTVWD